MSEISRELLGKIVDEVFDGAIEDASVIEDIYRVIAREQAALAVGQEPVGWLHTLHMELAQKERQLTFSPNDPFGEIGEDYDPTYVCISQPVYLAAPIAAPVQEWQDHQDQTSPMTVGPERFFEDDRNHKPITRRTRSSSTNGSRIMDAAEVAWDDLVNKDDRTSPEDYPDMALITREELAEYMSAALVAAPVQVKPLEPDAWLQSHPELGTLAEVLPLLEGDFESGWTQEPLYLHPAPSRDDVVRECIAKLQQTKNNMSIDYAVRELKMLIGDKS